MRRGPRVERIRLRAIWMASPDDTNGKTLMRLGPFSDMIMTNWVPLPSTDNTDSLQGRNSQDIALDPWTVTSWENVSRRCPWQLLRARPSESSSD